MQFKIRLVVAPGDTNVSRASISKINTLGTEEPEQMILEGETVECTVSVLEGEKLVVQQLEPPVYHDIDEKMAVNMTPEMIKTAAKEKAAIVTPHKTEPKAPVPPPPHAPAPHTANAKK